MESRRQDDYDPWGALGSPEWGWKYMLPYFNKVCFNICQNSYVNLAIKSETYNPIPDDEKASKYSIKYDATVPVYQGQYKSAELPRFSIK